MSDGGSVLGMIFGAADCGGPFDCVLSIDRYGIILWILFLVYLVKVLGVLCERYFIEALEEFKHRLGMSDDVAGACIFAPGSSAPEVFTNLVATFFIVGEGGVGAIIGSLVYNVLIMIGLPAICAPHDLKIWWYPVARDVVVFTISVAELLAILYDDKVETWEAGVMVGTYILYTIFMKFNAAFVLKMGLQQETEVQEIDVSVSRPKKIKEQEEMQPALIHVLHYDYDNLKIAPPDLNLKIAPLGVPDLNLKIAPPDLNLDDADDAEDTDPFPAPGPSHNSPSGW
ncbi:unnamed protein product [Polarella glacialis]|uniref:Sodium/calcium exchanger membrane region domain-containing protein n=1 Tax=Polarella glacialis TaxID=89957 RepID=A0A813JZ54_POLGL|nr:unnamed protein product [Polarella glacialis]